MNRSNLAAIIKTLPSVFRDRIQGYVSTVDDAKHSIFETAGIKFDAELSDSLLFVCGLKKLYEIVNSAFWILDNSNEIAQRNGVTNIRLGSTSLSRYGQYYSDVSALQFQLTDILREHDLLDIVNMTQLSEILVKLDD